MIRFAFLLLAMSSLTASDHLYFHEDEQQDLYDKRQILIDEELQHLSKPQNDRSEFKPIGAESYLHAKDTYLLKSKLWASIHITQAMFDLGKNSDFDDDSYVQNIERTVSVSKDSTKPKKRFMGFSFLGRDGAMAYGIGFDYFAQIEDQLTDILLVDSSSNSTSLKTSAAPFEINSDFVPILFKTRYYFTDGQMFQPFVGGGFGATYMKNSIEYDAKKFSGSTWSLYSMGFEAGTTICLTPNYSVDAAYHGVSAQFKSAIINDNGALIRLKSPMMINMIKVGLNIYW